MVTVGPQSVGEEVKTQSDINKHACLILEVGAAVTTKTEVNSDIKAASRSVWWKDKFSLRKAEQEKSKPARWGATFSCEQGFDHAEKTEVILFI